jgi:hypothetical protein
MFSMLIVILSTVHGVQGESFNRIIDRLENTSYNRYLSTNWTESRIIGGFNVSKGVYPFFAMALDASNQFFCGGSLVSPEFILTAAHCTTSSKWTLSKFLVGALCPFERQDNNCGQYYELKAVDKVYNHPSYNANTLLNDFSLVKLTSRSKVNPVTLDQRNITSSYASGKLKLEMCEPYITIINNNISLHHRLYLSLCYGYVGFCFDFSIFFRI